MEIAVKQEVGIVEFNFEELKVELESNLKKYKGLVIADESQVKEIKDVKSNLNKGKKAINDEKIRIKKLYCEPLTKFEDEVKELLAMIENVVTPIDDQIKAFEFKEKEDKRQIIIDYFDSTGFEHLSLNRLFDDKWLNKTCKDWQEQLDSKIEKIYQDLNLIELMSADVDYQSQVKSQYIQCLDIARAKQIVDEEIKRVAQFKAQQEAKQQEVEQTVVAPVIERVEAKQEYEVAQDEEFSNYYVTIEFMFDGIDDPKKSALLDLIKIEKIEINVLEKGVK